LSAVENREVADTAQLGDDKTGEGHGDVLRWIAPNLDVVATRRIVPNPPRRFDARELDSLHRWWRAANYLSVGQIYLMDNPLLREPLQREHIKKRLLGHWGTTPGLNFIYAHMNRIICREDVSAIFLAGPGHGGPAVVASAYLEGTYSEVYPTVSQDEDGLQRLFRQFSFPGGIPSHAAPETPGSIHEGGELGYVLSHAFGAAFDNPELIVVAVVGDGEAETGPLATSWHGNKFLNPQRDGAVLPILHLNGYKIANPTIFGSIPPQELDQLLRGCGWNPIWVEGSDPAEMHVSMAGVMDQVFAEIAAIQQTARGFHGAENSMDGEPDQTFQATEPVRTRPIWPMIVLRSPKGWTGPRVVDGVQIEGSWRSHQVPLTHFENDEHVALLEQWLRSYRPDELFDGQGHPFPQTVAIAPVGKKRMSANPQSNGGLLLRDLHLPDFRLNSVPVSGPGAVDASATNVQGSFLRDVMAANIRYANFRVFSPDENSSNRWQDILAVTDRCFTEPKALVDDQYSPDGRIMEVLSEHQCQGWLEGYLLTGRHGFFNCYEAFVHIVDSMFNQHAKWLKTSKGLPWRMPIASLNYLLSSHVWRQDHNGFSHQDPGFLDHVVNKSAEIVRVYLPPDANTLLAVTDHCLRSRDRINVVVAGKQVAPQWLGIDDAIAHVDRGIGIWPFASNDNGKPDVVIASCGDVPTIEALAAVEILRTQLPNLAVRFINIVDLMRIQDPTEHPHGLSHAAFNQLFPPGTPIIFAFHGYPWLIHRLTYRRAAHPNLHVRGYKEEGTTTTPFDMTVRNDIDRFHLVMDVIDRVPSLGVTAAALRQSMMDERARHRRYIVESGEDLPEIQAWRWA
jgi:xylulose-5-phosphate/fructose-6-phosphate phosphoketolase